MSRISDRVRKLVMERDRYACVACGATIINRPGSIHHRRPRGIGGSKQPDINTASNLIVLCGTGTTGCHFFVEANRYTAYKRGWLVHAWDNPADVPVTHVRYGVAWLLDDGTTSQLPATEAR